MTRERDLGIVGGVVAANAILIGAALSTTRPFLYLAVAAGVGTFINLTFLVANRLWQERR